MNAPGQRLPRILIVSVWFGPLPEWFGLWLASVRENFELDWLLLTNASTKGHAIPRNLHVVVSDMHEVAARIARAAEVDIHFEQAYKACDFRPLYWTLLDLVPGRWEFWGHCDMDMVFGNIRSFLTPEILSTHDRIYGVGHFSIYRNSSFANNMYKRSHPALDYKRILSDPQPRGFDEHLGVNILWRAQGDRFLEDERHIADIDPHGGAIRRISTISPVSNYHRQLFGYNGGRVFRAYYRYGQLLYQDFMYMHFQKRNPSVVALAPDCESVWLTPSGFVPMVHQEPTASDIKQLNPDPLIPRVEELSHRLRLEVRLYRRARDYRRS